MKIILGTAFFALTAVAVVIVGIPWLIVDSGFGPVFKTGGLRYLGIIPAALGAIFWSWSAWDFVTFGRGTPAPLYPPKNLVSRRLYRLVRNPMYVAVALMLVGEAVFLQYAALFGYAAAVWLFFHLFVVFYEEPKLKRSFGNQYEEYRSRVPRWLPKLLLPRY